MARAFGGFCKKRTFPFAELNDRVWVGSRHGSDRAADGRFARLLKISCQSAIDPEADLRSALIVKGSERFSFWVNARVYDAGDERNYRIPDLQVGDYTIEGTLWKKDLLTPQISDIASWSNPRTEVIINPYEHNNGRVTR